MTYTEIQDIAEFNDILLKNKFVVVDFYTSWCGPCKGLAPHFKKLAEKMSDKIKFCKVKCDDECKDSEEIINKCSIEAFPTILFYKDAKRVKDLSIEGADIKSIERNCNTLLEI